MFCFAPAAQCIGLFSKPDTSSRTELKMSTRHIICLVEAPVTLKKLISLSLNVYLEVHHILWNSHGAFQKSDCCPCHYTVTLLILLTAIIKMENWASGFNALKTSRLCRLTVTLQRHPFLLEAVTFDVCRCRRVAPWFLRPPALWPPSILWLWSRNRARLNVSFSVKTINNTTQESRFAFVYFRNIIGVCGGTPYGRLNSMPVFHPGNTLTYMPGIIADRCCLMTMMMVIVRDRSVAWSPGFSASQLLCNPSHG